MLVNDCNKPTYSGIQERIFTKGMTKKKNQNKKVHLLTYYPIERTRSIKYTMQRSKIIIKYILNSKNINICNNNVHVSPPDGAHNLYYFLYINTTILTGLE